MNISLLAIPALFLGMLLSSCASQSVFLQQLTTEGPVTKPPLLMTDGNTKGELRIVPKIAWSGRQTILGRTEGHSLVNGNGVYQVDTVNQNGSARFFERNGVNKSVFQERNFRWTPAKLDASLTLDYLVTNQVAAVLGGSYSSDGSRSFVGGIAGAGFLFEGKHLAARVDLGAQLTSVRYDVDYVLTASPFYYGSRDTEVEFFHETGKATYANAYGAFTVNTKVRAWPLQGFLQLAINRQTLVFLDRSTAISDKSVVLQSASFFIVTPGVYVDLGGRTRLVAGLHLADETELLEGDPGVLLTPFVQCEFGL